MQESDLPEFASPEVSLQISQRVRQQRLSESPEPSSAPPKPSSFHPTLDPDFDDEESPLPLAAAPQPMSSPYTQAPPRGLEDVEVRTIAPLASESHQSPYMQLKADVEVLDQSPLVIRRGKEPPKRRGEEQAKRTPSAGPPDADCGQMLLIGRGGDLEEDEYTPGSISNLDSLLIDLHRYTQQTGGRVSAQLKSRISQLVGQFAVRLHNLPPPQVQSRVKKTLAKKEQIERKDPLSQLEKAIDSFSVKVARDIQRMKTPPPATQVIANAMLEVLREVSNINSLCHPHRTVWEVFLYFLQQPGAAVTYIRSLPKYIRDGAISRKQIEIARTLLSEVASADLYEIDAAGATLILFNVTDGAVVYSDSLGERKKKEAKEEPEAGKLSKKVMSTHGKFLAKVITGNRSLRQFAPLRTKPIDAEEPPEPAVLPQPLTMNSG